VRLQGDDPALGWWALAGLPVVLGGLRVGPAGGGRGLPACRRTGHPRDTKTFKGAADRGDPGHEAWSAASRIQSITSSSKASRARTSR
jgi:hypothetical protein